MTDYSDHRPASHTPHSEVDTNYMFRRTLIAVAVLTVTGFSTPAVAAPTPAPLPSVDLAWIARSAATQPTPFASQTSPSSPGVQHLRKAADTRAARAAEENDF